MTLRISWGTARRKKFFGYSKKTPETLPPTLFARPPSGHVVEVRHVHVLPVRPGRPADPGDVIGNFRGAHSRSLAAAAVFVSRHRDEDEVVAVSGGRKPGGSYVCLKEGRREMKAVQNLV